MAAKQIAGIKLSDILSRVPPGQMRQFLHFQEKTNEYKSRVMKYPEHLPKIDWEYYHKNVREEASKQIEEFEKKYQELNKVFDDRHSLDTKHYYTEWEQLRAEVQVEVANYIDESNKRIKTYEAEIERIRSLVPVDQMTCEDYCDINPPYTTWFKNPDGTPSFWPHDEAEQKPGPVAIHHHDDDDDHGGHDGSSPVVVTVAEAKEDSLDALLKMEPAADIKADAQEGLTEKAIEEAKLKLEKTGAEKMAKEKAGAELKAAPVPADEPKPKGSKKPPPTESTPEPTPVPKSEKPTDDKKD